MDGPVSVFRVVFRNGVSEWMGVFRCFGTVFRNGWECFGMDGSVGGVSGKSVSEMPKVDGTVDGSVSGVSERCFGTWMGLFDVDGTVSVWCFGISGILVFRCIGASVFELHSSVAVV